VKTSKEGHKLQEALTIVCALALAAAMTEEHFEATNLVLGNCLDGDWFYDRMDRLTIRTRIQKGK
jgi:hypothetical protein